MITTVTLNPCMDLSVSLGSLRLGQLNLMDTARMDVAGKGINVSVVLKELGVETCCTGISYDGNGQKLCNYLAERGISHHFAVAPGEIRTNIKVLDTDKNEMTELNNRGVPVEPQVIEQYLAQLENCLGHSDMLVLSGRIPNGAEPDIYRRSAELAAARGIKTVVDAEGKPLRMALAAKPYLIKPNTFELEHTFGFKLRTRHDVLDACRELLEQGDVEIICVSMGKEGAVIASRTEAWYAPALEVETRGQQGAGDSMVAGICKAVMEGKGLREMLVYGVAASAASVMRDGTQLCRRQDFDTLVEQVDAQRQEEE